MPKKRILTLDEQLVAFLDQWEATRTAQATKYRLRAQRDREVQHLGWQMLYEGSMRSLRHYEHELKMLQELRRRAFTQVVRYRTLQSQP